MGDLHIEQRAYRKLLRLFPRSFREEYGEEMARLYGERLREVEGRSGARLRLRVDATMDLLIHCALEWGRLIGRASWTLLREGSSMDGWVRDVRFGARSLIRRPGFTAAAVATLGLGIGANVAMFSVVSGVLLRPLPYPEADRIVLIEHVDRRDGSKSPTVDHPDLRLWQGEIPEFLVAGFSGSRPTLTGMGDPEVVAGARVTDGLLGVFGLAPLLGRDLVAADDVPDGPRVVVVSHAFWTTRLARDPDALGRTIDLGGERWEVVGVAPEGFAFPDGTQLWLPRHHDVAECGHGCNIVSAVGRVLPGTTVERVQAALDATSDRLSAELPDSHRDTRVQLARLLDTMVTDVRSALWILMGAVGMVLLIACANVANLLLVRASDRGAEVALHATLGASRLRIARRLLTESALLACAGGAVGIGLSVWGISAVVALAPPDLPRLDEVGLDGRVLAFALLLMAAVTALFSFLPTVRLAARPLQAALSGGRRATEGGRGGPLSRSLLLSGEVALSLALLLGAGLLFGTLRGVRSAELGFAVERVERFRVSAPETRYDAEATIRLFDEIETRLAALSIVEGVGTVFGAPLGSGRINASVELLDRAPVDVADQVSLTVRPSSAGYREAAGISLIRGRWLEPGDRIDTEGVAVLNQAAVDRHYPGVDPIGRQIRMSISWGFADDPVRTIVGVVGDTRSRSAKELDEPAVYLPNAQFAANNVYVTMRLAPGVGSAIAEARALLAELDGSLAMVSVERMEEVSDRQLAPTRFYLTLLATSSVIALLLAAVGLYGVVAYAVSRRTREIGIRMALGARGDDVIGMVVREGMMPALAGVAVGLGVSWLGASLLQSLLYGVEPQDPATLGAVTGILLVVVLIATLVPARRASRIAPAVALRGE